MEEYVVNNNQRKSKLTWGAGLNSQLVPKNVKSKFEPIPVDNGIYGRNQQGYVISHNSQLENPQYLRDVYLKSKYHKGWSFTNNSDLDGDLIPDTVVYDEKHNPMVWNGYHYVRNAPMLEREVFMQNPDNEEKYGYSIKKYKFDKKSPFEKILSVAAKYTYDNIKAITNNVSTQKIILSDLSTNFIKTWIKQAILIPQLIKTGLIQGITIQQYVAALNDLVKHKDSDPEYKYGKAVDLMALFKLASKIFDSLPERDAETEINKIKNVDYSVIYKVYSKYAPFQGGNKIRFIIDWIDMLYLK